MIAFPGIMLACSRAPGPAAAPAPAATTQAVTEAPGTALPESKPPIAMKPVARTAPAIKAPMAQSLAGIDRHLAYRPFQTIDAGDFVLGQLVDRSNDPSLDTILDATAAALIKGTLPYDRLDADTATVARALYEPLLRDAPPIMSVRFARRQPVPGGGVAIGIRILAGTPQHSAQGLLLADQGAGGAWTIDHLELDIEALKTDRVREHPWDPYDTSGP